jgi:RNA polymerase primary sigma factor
MDSLPQDHTYREDTSQHGMCHVGPRQHADQCLSPRLDPAGERRRVVAAQRCAGPERDRFVQAYLPLISSIARIYRGSERVERIELMQEGVVGLLRALDRFDPSVETPFWAYASWWVRQAMQQLMAELSRPVVLSDRASRQLAAINHARREQLRRGAGTATSKTLAAATGLNGDQIAHLVAASRRPRALDEPIGSADGSSLTFGEQLRDASATEAYDRVDQQLAVDHLPELLACLDTREAAIVRARFGLDGDAKTLREVGAEFGISDERVRQLEQRALGKLHDLAFPAHAGARLTGAPPTALARH